MKETRTVLKKVYEAIDHRKGEEVVILDISNISSFTDYFVICHGHNQKQNQAICGGIQEKLKKENRLLPTHIEGYPKAEWILMDYLGFVVHILSPEARQFYKLEKFWVDGKKVRFRARTA